MTSRRDIDQSLTPGAALPRDEGFPPDLRGLFPSPSVSDAACPKRFAVRKPLRSSACQVPNARNACKEGFLSLTEQTRSEATNAQDTYDFGRDQRADGFRRLGAGRYVPKTGGASGAGGENRRRPA